MLYEVITLTAPDDAVAFGEVYLSVDGGSRIPDVRADVDVADVHVQPGRRSCVLAFNDGA